MRELLLGIIDFRRRLRPALLATFRKMATSQKPNSLFIACADSRVVPNLFASTNPGELFSIRNVGNLIPPPNEHDMSASDESEMAAVEFSLDVLGVRNIIVCGHSECGAMKAILQRNTPPPKPVLTTAPHLESWLRHGMPALQKFNQSTNSTDIPTYYNGQVSVPGYIDLSLTPQDQLSQVNVLQQVEHICNYKKVREKVQKGQLLIHAWWFDIPNANIYSFSDRKGRFVLIDDTKALEILERLGEHALVQEIKSKYEVTNFGNPAWTAPILEGSKITNIANGTEEHTHGCGCEHYEPPKSK
eukprot:Phypoly_transcript_12399.p1 GENE.Phypoly_transcript_12399~~Phypoly_transcript_12399.p1  ORF type:complete len:302 (+),score=34.88 Phypoly_transcript_12399:25-930(+)